ncbi:MAG TPA: type II secretion system protein GspG [Polyangia bacterium]|nr:type II secretion system protein GspG [Polyangia bacterium]
MTAIAEKQTGIARRAARVAEAGFTLIEIMIVLAIIALIAGGVGTAVFSQYKKAQVKIARQRVMAVKNGVSQYMIDNNGCPKGVDDLIAQKYLDRGNAKDPWGKDFKFQCPGTNDTDNADISSAGPDKQEGTPDDIRSWEQ